MTLIFNHTDENPVDPELSKKINIGFPQKKESRSKELYERLAHMRKQRTNPELEKLSKTGECECNIWLNLTYKCISWVFSVKVDLNAVHDEWLKTSGPLQIRRIADHYKIFEHLFGDAYFVPRVSLDIKYSLEDGETQAPVYYGNLLTPTDTQNTPEVKFDASFSYNNEKVDAKNTLWTLLMTNPDGHFEKENAEYVHWFM